ncbi:hypothetical protein HY413_00935 [Candidatus Kaiserbacteria bacterium]|nr:hypothetical protein [Candidatus Kaiserbacteria bacterium]
MHSTETMHQPEDPMKRLNIKLDGAIAAHKHGVITAEQFRSFLYELEEEESAIIVDVDSPFKVRLETTLWNLMRHNNIAEH